MFLRQQPHFDYIVTLDTRFSLCEPGRRRIWIHVISRKKLREFAAEHPDAEASLTTWWKLASAKRWSNIQEVKQDWSSADSAGNLTVFNIGGNKYRLIAFIDYEAQVILVRAVLTHGEYDRERWKNDKHY